MKKLLTTFMVLGMAYASQATLIIDQQNPGPGTGAIGLTAGVGMGQMTGHNSGLNKLAKVDILLSGSTSPNLTLNVWSPVCDQCWLSIGSPALLGTQTITPPNGGTAVFDFTSAPIDLSSVSTLPPQHRLMLELVAPDGNTGVFLTGNNYSGNLYSPSNSNGQLNGDWVFTTYAPEPSTIALLAIGGLALAGRRTRRS